MRTPALPSRTTAQFSPLSRTSYFSGSRVFRHTSSRRSPTSVKALNTCSGVAVVVRL